MQENDILEPYRNTKHLYAEVEAYLVSKNITTATPFPVVTVWVNRCIRRFAAKRKPPIKVLRMCIYYLEKIDYDY